MTVSKDGDTMMYLLIEENFDKLVEETGLPRAMWENAAAYDASVGLNVPSKVYVVPRTATETESFASAHTPTET